MKIVWHTSFRLTDNRIRNEELLFCLNKNLQNPVIDAVVYYGEEPISLTHAKLQQVLLNARPTFLEIFKYYKAGEINCLANGDIFANKTISLAKKIDGNEFWCLSRFNLRRKKGMCSSHRFRWGDSQDCWIVNGQAKEMGNFYMGVLGCDNLIAFEAANAGYKVTNPSYSVFMFHFHLSEMRAYSEATRVGTPDTIRRVYPQVLNRPSILLLRDLIIKWMAKIKKKDIKVPMSLLK